MGHWPTNQLPRVATMIRPQFTLVAPTGARSYKYTWPPGFQADGSLCHWVGHQVKPASHLLPSLTDTLLDATIAMTLATTLLTMFPTTRFTAKTRTPPPTIDNTVHYHYPLPLATTTGQHCQHWPLLQTDQSLASQDFRPIVP